MEKPRAPGDWKAPQPAERWTGVRQANAFGPRCVQPSRRENSISYFGPETESEDCLFRQEDLDACFRDDLEPVF